MTLPTRTVDPRLVEPTDPPPGWLTGPPDFVIAGAPKCGTTRWFRLMKTHPDVEGTHRPRGSGELHFFDQFYDHWPTAEDLARYHRFFPRPAGSIVGDKAPTDMSQHWVPAMLAEAAPDARLIVLVRDPLERFMSSRTFNENWRDTAVGRGRTPATFTRFTVTRSFAHGEYAQQLGWLLSAFPRDRILVQQFERCVADPVGELARTYGFLGVAAHVPTQEAIDKRVNPTRTARVVVDDRHRDLLRALFRPEVEALREIVPDLDLALWPNYADLT